MKKYLVANSWLAVCLCVLVAVSGCGDFKAKHKKTEDVSVPVAGEGKVRLKTNVGSIKID